MSSLLPRGTKVTIKVGDNTGKTGKIYKVFTEEPLHVYDVMVDNTTEVWMYAHAEVEPLNS